MTFVSHGVKMPKVSGTYKVPWILKILKILHDLNKVVKMFRVHRGTAANSARVHSNFRAKNHKL